MLSASKTHKNKFKFRQDVLQVHTIGSKPLRRLELPAKSYQKLLTYYKPKILLGLTATPERMDGLSVTAYFDHRIAAEIRLPEAIERRLLSPFQYFGVTDNVDLSDMKWSKGGYDKKALSNVYTLNRIAAQKRAQLIVTSVKKYVNEKLL